jgi:hypothetical protein
MSALFLFCALLFEKYHKLVHNLLLEGFFKNNFCYHHFLGKGRSLSNVIFMSVVASLLNRRRSLLIGH